ncbi:hypothetical protein NECID01_2192 [Nematocida sp. AWRm77]|nr:hypothetical protein NECID01_2192 [Nematocida sp. AWRm77]
MNFAPEVCTQKVPEFEVEWKNGEIAVTQESIFQLVRSIKDPEHDYTLEDLKVVGMDRVRLYALAQDHHQSQSQLQPQSQLHPHPQREGAVEEGEAEKPWACRGPVVVEIEIIPTIPHCSMVGLIGLSILYKLTKTLHSKYIVRVVIKEGTHTLDEEMTKQLADIERTYSAFLNPSILSTIISLI